MDRITFITNTTRHNVSYPTIDSESAAIYIATDLVEVDRIQLDYETTGLDPYTSKLLLTSINIGGHIYVIDNTSVDLTSILSTDSLEHILVISHNAKFEYKFSKVNGLQLGDMYCTMVAEQRLIQGTGLSSSLVETCKRRKIELPVGMDKDVRETFINADADTIAFTDEQILYSASDVIPLEDIMNKQRLFIEKYDMNHLIYNIEMPLISVLADSELYGFRHDSEKWINYAKQGEAKALEITQQLDELARGYGVNLESINPEIIKKNQSRESKIERLRERFCKLSTKSRQLEADNKQHTKAYQVTIKNADKVSDELFELNTSTSEEVLSGINWSSSDQVIKVFSSIQGFPIPKAKNKESKRLEPSIGKEARSLWISNNESSEFYKFFMLFDKYKKTIHNVNAFGEEWVRKYTHPITGRVHTYYWQCDTDTGRLASGDAKNGYLNIQQIPSVKELRASFIADEGYELVTTDYAGAELRIMCALADDRQLWDLGESGDIHSPIATHAWRNVYKNRGEEELSVTYEVTKQDPDGNRRKFKNITFGSIYGAYATKAATTVGVNKDEGQIVLDSIKEMIPKTFSMVEQAVEDVWKQGYLISDTRTNARKWFLDVVRGLQYGLEPEQIKDGLPFMTVVGIDSQARNFRIQATQANFMKEALVVIYKFNKLNSLDVRLMGTVHDETIYQYPIGLTVVCPYKGDTIPYAEYVSRAMINTANLYLIEPYLMATDYHVNKYWEK